MDDTQVTSYLFDSGMKVVKCQIKSRLSSSIEADGNDMVDDVKWWLIAMPKICYLGLSFWQWLMTDQFSFNNEI